MLIVTLLQTKPCPLTVFNNKTRPPTGSVNLQRSYEICRAVVEKSANRAKVEAQLVAPPASKQRRLSATSAASVASALPVSLPPGATILVQAAPAPAPAPATSAAVVSGAAATNVVTAAAVKPPPTFAFGPRLAVAGQPLAVRGLRPPAGGQLPVAGVTGIRLKLPASAVPVSGGQVVLQRPLLQQQPQAIVVRTSNPFSLQTSAASLVKAVPGSLVAQLPAASSSLPPAPAAVSCALTSSSAPACLLGPGGQAAPPPVALSPCSPVSMTNNNLFSNSFNISTVAPRTITTLSSSPSLLPSSACLPPLPPPAAPQFIIRYLAAPPAAAVSPLVASAGTKHFIIQPPPAPLPSDKPSLQVSCAPQLVTRLPAPAPAPAPTPPSSPSPKSPKAASFNPASIIQQITQPCTPPPPPAPPVSLVQTSPRPRQQVVFRAAKPIQRIIIPQQQQHNNIVTKQQPQQLQSVFASPQLLVKAEDENFTKPLPPIQTNIKTVRGTTLVPRSPVSDDQISSILGSCVPEPQAVCRISPEEKEKASAVAALAANNFDEGKLSPTKVVSPGLSPSGGSTSSSSSMFPIIQPLEIPENGTEVADVESSLENVTIPEIAEDISNDDKPKDKSAPLTLSNSRIVLKVGFCLLLLYPSGTYLCMHDV